VGPLNPRLSWIAPSKNKNEYRDAEAIAEAVERKNMRFVPIKTEDQLDLQALHRVREVGVATNQRDQGRWSRTQIVSPTDLVARKGY